MMSLELAKQRREEVMREVELHRLAKRVRATRKRQAGRLLKLLTATPVSVDPYVSLQA